MNNLMYILTNKLAWLLYMMVLIYTFIYTFNCEADPLVALPLSTSKALNMDKVKLGGKLFNNKALLKAKSSCASCHQLAQGGDSGHQKDMSHGQFSYLINTPSIFNVRYNFRQDWDGSDHSLKSQLEKIFNNPALVDNQHLIIRRLKQDAEINASFNHIYRQGITIATIIDSLVEFEKSLVTPNSRFDQYLNGNKHALTDDEIAGYHLFRELGCVSCHQGINIGGNLFQKFGIFYNYLAQRGHINHADYGRFNITGRKMDKFVLKVPSLRNVAVTAPYLHDGSAKTLEQAILIIGRTELGRNLDTYQVHLLKTFLLTLTGQYNNRFLVDDK